MKKVISTATKVAAVAFAMSTFSFAGPGLADGAANSGTRLQQKTNVSGLLSKALAANSTGVVVMLHLTGQRTTADTSSSMLLCGVPSTRTG